MWGAAGSVATLLLPPSLVFQAPSALVFSYKMTRELERIWKERTARKKQELLTEGHEYGHAIGARATEIILPGDVRYGRYGLCGIGIPKDSQL